MQVALELHSKLAECRGAVEGHAAAPCDHSERAHGEATAGDENEGEGKEGWSDEVPDKRCLMDKLDKLMQRYDSNGMARCGWLDVLALRRIDQLNQATSNSPALRARSPSLSAPSALLRMLSSQSCSPPEGACADRMPPPLVCGALGCMQAMGEGSKRPVLMVEMERWDRCVMYGVKSYSVVPVAATWCVADAELCCDSPVEVKHRKLSRSLHRALVDRNLQPDSQERRQIQVA